jgi:hypothetical protein
MSKPAQLVVRARVSRIADGLEFVDGLPRVELRAERAGGDGGLDALYNVIRFPWAGDLPAVGTEATILVHVGALAPAGEGVAHGS